MAADRVALALGGGTIAIARDREVTLRTLAGERRAEVTAPARVDRLVVAPDGDAVIGVTHGAQAWRWSERDGLAVLAIHDEPRDHFGVGFVRHRGRVLTLVAQRGRLRGLDGGVEAWSADLRSPRSFYAASFAALPGDRLALVGHEFSDSLDRIVTVRLEELAADPAAFQRALARNEPVADRALRVAIGPAAPDAAVAYRDPEDEEVPADEEEEEDLGDVENFVGLYVRELASGALVQRLAYAGRPRSSTGLAATARHVAVETESGLDLVDRATGVVGSLRLVDGAARIAWPPRASAPDLAGTPAPAAVALDVATGDIIALDAAAGLHRTSLAELAESGAR